MSSEDPEDDPNAEFSSQWFAYIAVGIAVVSLLVGLLLMGWILYVLIRGLM